MRWLGGRWLRMRWLGRRWLGRRADLAARQGALARGQLTEDRVHGDLLAADQLADHAGDAQQRSRQLSGERPAAPDGCEDILGRVRDRAHAFEAEHRRRPLDRMGVAEQ